MHKINFTLSELLSFGSFTSVHFRLSLSLLREHFKSWRENDIEHVDLHKMPVSAYCFALCERIVRWTCTHVAEKKITKKEKRKQHTISFGWEWHLFFVFPLECDITCLVWLCTPRAKGDTKTIDDMIKCLAMCDTRALAYWKLRQRQWWKWFFLYVFRVLTILSRHIFLSWRKIHDTNTCIIRDVFFFLCVSLDSGRKIQCSFIYMTQNEWASFSIHSTETTTETFSSRFFLATVRIAAAAIVVVVWCLSFTVNKVKSMMCTCVSHCLSLGAT